MASIVIEPPNRKSLTLSLTWLLTAGLFLVTIENVWVDPWLHFHWPDFPSLVPEPPSALWLASFAVIGLACVTLLVGQVLLMRRTGVSLKAKVAAGTSVAAAVALSILWFCVTSGITPAPRL